MKMLQGIPHYRTDELERMETRAQGQADDLKWESGDGRTRIWLSRVGRADGEPFEHTVTVERLSRDGGRWEQLYRYDGDHVMTVTDDRRGGA